MDSSLRSSGTRKRSQPAGRSKRSKFGSLRSAAWALRLGFVVALLLAVWLSRPADQPPSPLPASPSAADRDRLPSAPVRPQGRTAKAPREEKPDTGDAAGTRPADDRIANPPGDVVSAGLAPRASANVPSRVVDSQVRQTLERIAAGGPFPYRQDDTVFLNREGRLPKQRLGYYREYTVETPGAGDRGPRRIVRGDEGELYLTEDHYQSFVPIDKSGNVFDRATTVERRRHDAHDPLPEHDFPGSRNR